jgi:hypothetical protein
MDRRMDKNGVESRRDVGMMMATTLRSARAQGS